MNKLRFYLTVAIVFAICAVAVAQTVEPGEYLNKWTEALYGAIIIITGFLSNLIPGINKINKGVWRVAALALVSGVMFVMFTPMTAIQAIISYAMSTSFYELVLKPVFKKKTDAVQN